MCTGFSLKKTSTVSLSIDVRITMISCVVYLLRIFKSFHGLTNNPVFSRKIQRKVYLEELGAGANIYILSTGYEMYM